jgi:antirestriction protein ArdC
MQPSVHLKQDVYASITENIIAAIEKGAEAFVLPWHRLSPALGKPANAQTQMPYRGINVVALWACAITEGYGSGWWATYHQWDQLGAQVGKGQRGAPIVFYQPVTQLNEEANETSQSLIVRTYRVFNQDQVEGWEAPATAQAEPLQVMNKVQQFVSATAATIEHGGDEACFIPSRDVIRIPRPEQFQQRGGSAAEAYYSTLLHELTHWTGTAHRLDRVMGRRFGDDAYAMEELVAELGAAFLCGSLGIGSEPRPSHAAYLSSWLRVLKADHRAIFTAAHKAKEAATFLEAFSMENATQT